MSVFILWKWLAGEKTWTIVGQYPTRRQAELIAEDYRGRGERVKIERDE